MKKTNNKRFCLKVESAKYISTDNNPVIRVSADIYNILVELANKTGLSLAKVANQAVAYAYENYSESEGDK